ITIGVTGNPTDAVVLRPNPESGIAPLQVTFSVSAPRPVTQVALDFDGNGSVDFQGASLDGQGFTYAQPGLYVASVAVTDSQGTRTNAAAIIQVFDRAQLDALLQRKWADLKAALGRGDIPAAVSGIVVGQQDKYQRAFQDLAPILPSVGADLRGLTLISVVGGIVEYATTQDRDGGTFVHLVSFVQDTDGVWKILGM
ncbi:MAG: PKD domain-containing protein, partial [Fimbriimonadales bacterium]